ncbi:prepilin-type N-terminal cleavage/methylation domain-containing protein [Antiquaquibacter soli]|uniref:Prepilin-type N-terminal cleavage/methylation domain-containing protein n=1 Tax=Antiquaquibacter soli TaxID=3064523 RepID=A0ABT9BQE8_9MICO|nr:prepilin-type N-terminal cleavage/methylation domain-containing protein [Protaetiibacter sp. WY-16]MDO7882849.1 prepilin-type N-terminal cleavage/methylation domain-containing protein [Protaetiibacter sp. WY-16]
MRRSDSGLTLIELMVAGLILSLVLLAIGGITVGILSAQRTVAAVTQTATSAQSAATAIATGVRNASDVRLSTPTGSDQLLVVRTANTTSTLSWSCRAWYYQASTGTIRTKVTTGAAIPAPNSTQLATWSTLVTGVTPASGTQIFSVVAGGISITYNATISNGRPVAIDTTAIKRTGVAEVGSCY